jgi:PAS domain S-box-containing protein
MDEYQRLFDANPTPMWVVDRETRRFVAVNEAALAKLGRTREELLATTAENEAGTPITFMGKHALLVVAHDRSAERRLQAIVDHSADGMALIGADSVTRWANPGLERILGYRADEVVGRPTASFTHRDEAGPPPEGPPPNGTKVYVARVRRSDGTWRWVETAVTNKLDDPDLRAFITSVRDVTERVEAEQSARAAEANFRTLVEHSPSAVFVHRGGIIIYVNPPCVRLLGYDRAEELLGRSAIELAHPDDVDEVRRRMANTEARGNTPAREARMIRKDGKVVHMELEGVLLDWGGEPATVVLGRDLTERRELFARLAVADRMLSVGTLAAGVAHEINNPIAFVISNLALLEEAIVGTSHGARVAPADVAALFRDARDGAARVAAIVRDLGALSRADDDARGPVDVRQVLAFSIKMAQNELRHRARVVQRFAPELPSALANESRLGQVFLNLLVNAAQALPDGHADENEIRVRAHPSADGLSVVVEVEDTGPGIPPDVLGRIFDPFFTTKPLGVGTGLGLAICHGIVHRLGGEISVATAPDRGTCFTVTLPRAIGAPAPARPPSPSRSDRRARILFIDDEASLGNSVRLLLQREHDVVSVTTARRALELISEGDRFDLILCDIMMPEMGGIQLHAELAAIAPEYLSRMIFLTGGAFTEEAQEFLDHVPNPPIEKPFSEDELRVAISETLAARNQTHAPS